MSKPRIDPVELKRYVYAEMARGLERLAELNGLGQKAKPSDQDRPKDPDPTALTPEEELERRVRDIAAMLMEGDPNLRYHSAKTAARKRLQRRASYSRFER